MFFLTIPSECLFSRNFIFSPTVWKKHCGALPFGFVLLLYLPQSGTTFFSFRASVLAELERFLQWSYVTWDSKQYLDRYAEEMCPFVLLLLYYFSPISHGLLYIPKCMIMYKTCIQGVMWIIFLKQCFSLWYNKSF